jgi:hypothetical protein
MWSEFSEPTASRSRRPHRYTGGPDKRDGRFLAIARLRCRRPPNTVGCAPPATNVTVRSRSSASADGLLSFWAARSIAARLPCTTILSCEPSGRRSAFTFAVQDPDDRRYGQFRVVLTTLPLLGVFFLLDCLAVQRLKTVEPWRRRWRRRRPRNGVVALDGGEASAVRARS